MIVPLIPKPHIENYRTIYIMNIDAEIFNKMLSNGIQKIFKKIFYEQVHIIIEMQVWFKTWKPSNIFHHINKLKDKRRLSHYILKKSLWQNQRFLHDKRIGEIWDTWSISKYNKGKIQQTNTQHKIIWRETQSNFSKIGYKTSCHITPYLLNIVLEVVDRSIGWLKEVNGIEIRKGYGKEIWFTNDIIVYKTNTQNVPRELL